MAFSPDSKHLAAGCSDGNIVIWDIEQIASKIVRKLIRAFTKVVSIAFYGENRVLAVGLINHNSKSTYAAKLIDIYTQYEDLCLPLWNPFWNLFGILVEGDKIFLACTTDSGKTSFLSIQGTVPQNISITAELSTTPRKFAKTFIRAQIRISHDVAPVQTTDANPTRYSIKVTQGRHLKVSDRGRFIDPYIIMGLANQSGEFLNARSCVKSEVQYKSADPAWEQVARILHVESTTKVRIEVWDKNILFDDFLGVIVLESIEVQDKWWTLTPRNASENVTGELHIVITEDSALPMVQKPTPSPSSSMVFEEDKSMGFYEVENYFPLDCQQLYSGYSFNTPFYLEEPTCWIEKYCPINNIKPGYYLVKRDCNDTEQKNSHASLYLSAKGNDSVRGTHTIYYDGSGVWELGLIKVMMPATVSFNIHAEHMFWKEKGLKSTATHLVRISASKAAELIPSEVKRLQELAGRD
eukprot:Phypoly_transcript_06371.p1 GENE.Phypoly_transcript_06371~~Phypoly_transcript_06371.p1  ORF type:complete len:467 (+),score=51.17 Phypoly_transcript_06371:323-1723(+)